MANPANGRFLNQILQTLEDHVVNDQNLESLETKLCGNGVIIPAFFRNVIQQYLDLCIRGNEIGIFIDRLNNTNTPWPLRAFEMAYELITKQEQEAGKANAGFELNDTLRERIALNPYMAEVVIEFFNSTPEGQRSDYLHLLGTPTVSDPAVVKGLTYGLTRAQAETDALLKDATIEESNAIAAYIDFVKGTHEAGITPEQFDLISANITNTHFDQVQNIDVVTRISVNQIWALSFGFSAEQVRAPQYGFEHPYMIAFVRQLIDNNINPTEPNSLEIITNYKQQVETITNLIDFDQENFMGSRDAVMEYIAYKYPNLDSFEQEQLANDQVATNIGAELQGFNNNQILASCLPNVELDHVRDLKNGLDKVHNYINLKRHIEHGLIGTDISNFARHIFYSWYHTLSDQQKTTLNDYVNYISEAPAVENNLWISAQERCPLVGNDHLVDFIGYLLTTDRHDVLANIAEYSNFNKYQLLAIQQGHNFEDVANLQLNEHQLSALQMGFTFDQIRDPQYRLDQPVIRRFLQANPEQTQTEQGRQELLERITGARQLFEQAVQDFSPNQTKLFRLMLAMNTQTIAEVGPDQLLFAHTNHINFNRLHNTQNYQQFDIELIENAYHMTELIDSPTAEDAIEAMEDLLIQIRHEENHRIHDLPALDVFHHYLNFPNEEQRTLFIDLPNLEIENLNDEAAASLANFNTRNYIHGAIENLKLILERVTVENGMVISDQFTEPRSLDDTILSLQQQEPEILEFLASHENLTVQNAQDIYAFYCQNRDQHTKANFTQRIAVIINWHAWRYPGVIDVLLNMPEINNEHELNDTTRIIEMLRTAPNLQVEDITYLRNNNTILNQDAPYRDLYGRILKFAKKQLLEPAPWGNLFDFTTFPEAVEHLGQQNLPTLRQYKDNVELVQNCPLLTREQVERTFNLGLNALSKKSAKLLTQRIYNNIHSDGPNRYSFESVDQAFDIIEGIFNQFEIGADIAGYGVIETAQDINNLRQKLLDVLQKIPSITKLDGELFGNILAFDHRFFHRQRGEFIPILEQLGELNQYQLKAYLLGLTHDNCTWGQHDWHVPEVAQASIQYLEQEAEQAAQQGIEFDCNRAFENIMERNANQILLQLHVHGQAHEHAVQPQHEFHNV